MKSVWVKILLTILIGVTLLGLVACCLTGERILNSDIKSVTLKCYDACLSMKDQPFLEKTYDDKNSINLFVKAINKSDKLRTKGESEYVGIFLMSVLFNDGKTDEYTLNVEENYSTGLLLKSSKTYRISEKLTQELKDIIYTN